MAMDVCKKNQIREIVVGAQHITSAYRNVFPSFRSDARWGVGVGEVL